MWHLHDTLVDRWVKVRPRSCVCEIRTQDLFVSRVSSLSTQLHNTCDNVLDVLPLNSLVGDF